MGMRSYCRNALAIGIQGSGPGPGPGPNPIPAPGALLLASLGTALIGYLRGRRAR